MKLNKQLNYLIKTFFSCEFTTRQVKKRIRPFRWYIKMFFILYPNIWTDEEIKRTIDADMYNIKQKNKLVDRRII